MPNNVTTENITKKDLIDNIKKTKNLTDELNQTKNKLDQTIKFLNNIGAFIDSRIKNYMETLNSNNSNEKSQTEAVEPKKTGNNELKEKEDVKESKLDISKFIEVFSQEFDFINKDEFNDEMENDEIMGKIIELIKRMLGIKDNEINEKKKEIAKLNTKKDELENNIKTLNSNIIKKENQNKLLEEEKVGLERNIGNLNHKVTELETLKNNLERNISQLDNDKIKLESDLKSKGTEIKRLEGIEKDLEKKNSELIKDKENLNKENKEKDKKLEKFMTKYEEKEKELKSVGDLLEARKLYDKYLSMETRILSKLDNVLIQRDFESFISSGYTLSSLDNVWDIVKIEYKNISNEDKEILKEVFSFFLNQINKRFKEAKYGLVQVEVGEDFDAVNQVDLSQNSRGRVSECVFYGYGFLKEKEDSKEEDVVTRIIKSPLVLTV